MNDFVVDENDRPTFPPKIISTDVVWNPFDDIVPRENKRRKLQEDTAKLKPQKLKPIILLINLC
jgi:peptidyl-prolyl cis-trans isomerase SDCCAG10